MGKLALKVAFFGHTNSVNCLAGLRNGRVASGSIDKTIKIWDFVHDKLLFTFDSTNGGHIDIVWTMSLLDNGFLVSGSFDASIKLWNVDQMNLVFTFNATNGRIKNIF